MAGGKGVLEAVGNEFVDDQADVDGEVDRNDHFGQVVEQFYPRLGFGEHVSDPPAEVADIAAELDPGDVLAMIQMVVDQAQRADAPGQGRQIGRASCRERVCQYV